MQLKNKTIIITGASSGIGAAAALLFAREGANLVLGARRSDKLEKICKKIFCLGAQAEFVSGDVTNENFSKQLVGCALDRFGQLDGSFNNAGTMGNAVPIPDMSSQDWNEVISTNLTSAFYATKHQIPAMQDNGGSIVINSSFVGYTASLPGMGAYAASKAGLIGLVQTLATEWGEANIRVNALLPGGTKTDMAGDIENDQDHLNFLTSLHALKRLAEPTEIANTAMFMLSDQSSFMTGSAIICDGGNSIAKI